MDVTEVLEKIGKAEWFEKELLWYDVKYNVIGFNTRIHHPDLISNLPRFATEFKVIDIRTGKKYDAYMNVKQYQISSLKPLYDVYPNIEVGNIIGVAISPENKNEVLVDFEYQMRADQEAKEAEDTRIAKDKDEKEANRNVDIEALVKQMLTETIRLGKLAEDDKAENAKTLADIERKLGEIRDIEQRIKDDKTIIRGREEVEKSIINRLGETKEVEQRSIDVTKKFVEAAKWAENAESKLLSTADPIETEYGYRPSIGIITTKDRAEVICDEINKIGDKMGFKANVQKVKVTRTK